MGRRIDVSDAIGVADELSRVSERLSALAGRLWARDMKDPRSPIISRLAGEVGRQVATVQRLGAEREGATDA